MDKIRSPKSNGTHYRTSYVKALERQVRYYSRHAKTLAEDLIFLSHNNRHDIPGALEGFCESNARPVLARLRSENLG